MKAKELRNMSVEEIDVKIQELKGQLFDLRFRHAIGQLNNPMQINLLKKDIARLETIRKENLVNQGKKA